MNCTLCDTPLTIKSDAYYFHCLTCGAFVKDKRFYLTASQERSRYINHNNDVNDVAYQRFTAPITDYILENFDANSTGLDYGCGTGPVISKQLQAKGFRVTLFDPFFYPDEDYLNHRYDYVFSCEVFEHFYNPKHELNKLIALLKSGGILLVMTHVFDESKNFDTWYYRKDPTHVFIYTAQTFNYIRDAFNLDLVLQTERLIVLRKQQHAN